METPNEPDLRGAAGLRVLSALAELAGIGPRGQCAALGHVAPAALLAWRRAPAPMLTADVLTRLSYVVGIYTALRTILFNPHIAHQWLTSPNTEAPFAGRPPRALLTSGRVEDLAALRAYLGGLAQR